MNGSTLAATENQIFARYRKHHPGEPILPDGAAHPVTYLAPRNFRILFVLKEGNDLKGQWTRGGGDLRDLAHSGGRFATWHNLATWIALANRLPVTKEDRRRQEWRAEQLRKGVFVNVKKVPGTSTSKTADLVSFALQAKHQSLLRSQIELYKPKITIACGQGIFKILEETFNGTRHHPKESGHLVEDGFLFFKKKTLGTVIDFYHPEARLQGGWERLAAMFLSNLNYHFPAKYPSNAAVRSTS